MNKQILKLSEKFKALGHPARLQIVLGLIKHKDDSCNVNKIAERLNIPQPTISQHLNLLKKAGIIEAEKTGVNTCHRVIDEQIVSLFEKM